MVFGSTSFTEINCVYRNGRGRLIEPLNDPQPCRRQIALQLIVTRQRVDAECRDTVLRGQT